MPQLTDWAVLYNPYAAPEIMAARAGGIRQTDGIKIVTSVIVEVLGPRKFRTASGSVYELTGDANQKEQAPSNPLGWVGKCLEAQRA